MRRIVFCSFILFVFCFNSVGEENSRFSKLLLGITGVYANYSSLENQWGLSIKDDKFLLGFDVGVVVNNVVFSFSYASKVYPVSENSFKGYRVIDFFDVYSLGLGYLFGIFKDYLYVGPVLGISIDCSVLKFHKNVDFGNIGLSEVKNIDSKTLSIGIGLKIVGFRNVFVSGCYFYSFPNVYYYDGVLVENSPVFRPQGLRVITSLCF